jgi:Fe2+ transport system protein FeoA
MTLADLKLKETATVVGLMAKGEVRRRLLDMGLVNGVTIEMVRYAPLGDPLEIRIKSFNLTLRVAEAKTILVEKE